MASGRPTVLVVDDDPDFLEVAKLVLSRIGANPLIAPGGREALEIIQGPARYDLVLLDLMMPVVDGFQVLEALRASPERPIVPILVISAMMDPGTPRRVRELGADEFVNKNIEIQELIAKVREKLVPHGE
jgi:CheY-like chemotaxis protein